MDHASGKGHRSPASPGPAASVTPAQRSFAAVGQADRLDVSWRFGQKLRTLRRQRNMTQLRMAIDFGIDRSFISDVERGRKSISLPMLEVMALGLDITLSDLLEGL